jgi:hypothetical protein
MTIILQTVITYCTSNCIMWHAVGQDGAVGIATHYWLDGPGTNPEGDDIARTVPESRPASYKMGTCSFWGIRRTELRSDHPFPFSTGLQIV